LLDNNINNRVKLPNHQAK